MNENLQQYMNRLRTFWKERSTAQKMGVLGGIIAFIVLLVSVSMFASNTKMVPIYSNLSPSEAGQITEELQTRGVQHELSNQGTTVLVPEQQVDQLLVELASQGLPNSGNIDYSFFSSNASWGMTDNEFDVIELDAMQSELSQLISTMEGINNAKVMINRPEESVFMNEKPQDASASIVIETVGSQFDQAQVQSLYNLVSKAVPNLPTDNIVIMNQNFEYFDLDSSTVVAGTGNQYESQQGIKDSIESDIQEDVQKMLATMIGPDKVRVSVTADVDFKQESRTEELAQPVDEEDTEGLPVSVERITETYSGDGAAEGVAGTGEDDVANYNTETDGENGDYESMKETINYEYNKIKKNIVESPYKLRDLGIQVAVDTAKEDGEDGEATLLTQAEQQTVQASISSILNSIVSTSISPDYGEFTPEEKTSIVFQEFNGTPDYGTSGNVGIPTWVYIVGGALLLFIIILLLMLVRKRNRTAKSTDTYQSQQYDQMDTPIHVPDIDQEKETEESVRRKQLERMAKERPEEFAKLLRSWIAED
ncbi:flagellar M-ring protein FliF [Pontibacillus halophilus JSM 076056 = DSM 19796]|uniref:Flagellar M-ring protein n=1 Tax=Pontibacillus halophilus JSM 076056 = DSM 19796 TaxID=1385510 RepID=A0A0A5IBF4_9BACI|nr:flagellar basal-body MS-ring/collar protein FliF [Pontibacillus halophilus]KGX93172.1 flagellar M-ring protein FliF [Pontibacillus halophilus JSM 076056 = DSM 19796]